MGDFAVGVELFQRLGKGVGQGGRHLLAAAYLGGIDAFQTPILDGNRLGLVDGCYAFGDQPAALPEGVDPSPGGPLPEGALGFVDLFQSVDQPLHKLDGGSWGLNTSAGIEVDIQNVGGELFGPGLGCHRAQQAALAHPAQAEKAGRVELAGSLAQVVRAAELVQQLIDDFVPANVGQVLIQAMDGFRHRVSLGCLAYKN